MPKPLVNRRYILREKTSACPSCSPIPSLPKRIFNAIKTDHPKWVHPLTILILLVTIVTPICACFDANPHGPNHTSNHPITPASTTNCNTNSALYSYTQSGSPTPNTNPFINAPGIKDTQTDQYGNVIGLSAGTTILDITQPNNDEMQQGAKALQDGDASGALAHFGAASSFNPEAAIYVEDLNVLAKSSNSYIAVVLGLDVTKGRTSSARASMRGAYLAQKAYNQSASQYHCPSLIVILASSGAVQANTIWVAQQIIALKKADNHVIGVVGWSISSDSINAHTILAQQPNASDNVFMLAPSSSSTNLTGYANFLRIVPSDTEQAQVMADYAYNTLNDKKIVIMYTSLDNYSVSLDLAFRDAFRQKGGIVIEQLYTQEDRPSVEAALNNALTSNPDAIYFSGFPDDIGPMLNLPQIAKLPPDFKILGGDALAALGNYPPNQQNMNRLVITSWTAQDEWEFLRAKQLPFISTFTNSYISTFDTDPIGPNTMLVYDATSVFLRAYQKATVNGGTSKCVSCALQNAFLSMSGPQAWQGVTGQVAFASGRTEPTKKMVLVVSVVNGALKTVGYRGCFMVGGSDCK